MGSYNFLQGGGEMGAITRSYDWASTSLGDPAYWPQSLRTSVSTVLNSRFPMFFYWGPELICFYNDAYRPSLGNNGKHPQLFGKPAVVFWAEIWHILEPLIQQVLSGGGATWSEDQLIPFYRNGRVEDIYWTFSYSPVIDESGEPAGILVACTETTDKVLSLRAMSQSREELQFAIDAAELGTFDLDPQTNKFVANERLRSWFGLPATSEIDLQDALDAISAKDRGRVVEAIRRSVQDKDDAYDIVYTINNKKDGTERIVKAKGKALFNAEGICYRFSGTLQEITEELKAENELQHTNQRLSIALDAASLGSYEIAAETGVMECTAQCKAHFGKAPDEVFTFAQLLECIHPDSRKNTKKTFDEAIRDQTIYDVECLVKWRDDSMHWIKIAGKPGYDHEGKASMIGVTFDITEQKQLHQQKDDFIGIASHELRTPITSLKGYTQVMEKIMRKKGNNMEANMLLKMDTQINRLTSLITNLLDVTKINSGRLQLKNSIIDVNLLVKDVVEELQRTAERHILVEDLQETGSVYADPERISQVIVNLITNAIKYSPNAEKIIVSTCRADDAVHVCVEDFGIGIEQDTAEKVFEQFYRVSGDMQHTFPGLGLGLYISSEIIQRAGGKLWVTSAIGKGSKFCFSLPLDRA